MKILCAGASFLLLTGSALAGPLDGRWALAQQDCTQPPGTSDRVPMAIAGNEIKFHESSCVLSRLEAIGEGNAAWRVTRICSAEGESWSIDSIFALDRDPAGDSRQLIEIGLEDGNVIVRKSCR